MPRLRHYKIFEQLVENNVSQISEDDNGRYNSEPIRGWYSTPNIIAGLSNKQIETNIQYHKTQIRILEEELLNRELGIKSHIPFPLQDFRQTENLELQQAYEAHGKLHKRDVRYIMKTLLPTLKNIRRKHGMNVFEYCRSGWMEILEEYYAINPRT